MPRPLQKLSRKHKIFVQYYIESNNATEAAIKAGFKQSNAGNTGYLLTQESVIKEYMATEYKKVHMSRSELKGIISKKARDIENDVSNGLRACELLARIDGHIKSDSNQSVNVLVDAGRRTSDILSKRFSKASDQALSD